MASALVILVLVVIAVLSTIFFRVAFSVLAVVLTIFGVAALIRRPHWEEFLSGGELKGLAPFVLHMGIAALAIAAVLLVGAWLAKKAKALVVVALVLIYAVSGGLIYGEAVGFGGFLRAMWRTGALEQLIAPMEMREYQGTSRENLLAIYTAMKLEHDSEEAFPPADQWMDKIRNRITTADMSMAESEKKFENPLIRDLKKGEYGYAMNEAAGGKYIDDIPNADNTLLIFDSKDRSRNAHGKPEELLPKPPRQGGNLGITVTGRLVEILEDGTLKELPGSRNASS